MQTFLCAFVVMGATLAGSAADAPQLMRLAIAVLCSLRRWPYARATKAPAPFGKFRVGGFEAALDLLRIALENHR
jgi:hypothetical protein